MPAVFFKRKNKMTINDKVEYLKQFLSEGQLSLLSRMYPTGEYTKRAVEQIEKTLSDQAKRVEDLQKKIKELEAVPPVVIEQKKEEKVKKVYLVEANFDFTAKFFTEYEIEAESEEEAEEIADKYMELELSTHPFSEIEQEEGEFTIEEK
jgi:short-subunit dehydrogenase involved in D-alanine esterification of teichoic acids